MQDFNAHFEEQLYFLRSSAQAYDHGVEVEAKRLAATIRNLAWDKGENVSLLTHIGVKEKLGFIDTAPPDPPPPPVVVLSFGLAVVEMLLAPPGGTYYVPAFKVPDDHRNNPPTCFADWWTLPVLRDQQGHAFSREDLVLGLAHKDGGVHIDKTIKGAYAALTRDNSLGFTQGSGAPMANSIVNVSVRQIAWELDQALGGVTWEGDKAIVANPICPLPYATQPKVARNDPCPCGSGRRLKQCFGRRQPRLKMSSNPDREYLTPQTSQGQQIPGTAISHEPPGEGPPRMNLDCLVLVPVEDRPAA